MQSYITICCWTDTDYVCQNYLAHKSDQAFICLLFNDKCHVLDSVFYFILFFCRLKLRSTLLQLMRTGY